MFKNRNIMVMNFVEKLQVLITGVDFPGEKWQAAFLQLSHHMTHSTRDKMLGRIVGGVKVQGVAKVT